MNNIEVLLIVILVIEAISGPIIAIKLIKEMNKSGYKYFFNFFIATHAESVDFFKNCINEAKNNKIIKRLLYYVFMVYFLALVWFILFIYNLLNP